MGFPRQEYWSGLPFPPPGNFPDPGIKPMSPALQADSSCLSHQGSPEGLLFTEMLLRMDKSRAGWAAQGSLCESLREGVGITLARGAPSQELFLCLALG